jgi:hypothetical protein
MLHPSIDMKHSEFQQNTEREIHRFGEPGKRNDSTSLSRTGILESVRRKGHKEMEGRH